MDLAIVLFLCDRKPLMLHVKPRRGKLRDF